MPKIVFKFASRSRPVKFFNTLDNIISMAKNDDFVILCSLDLDDLTMNNPDVRSRIATYKQVLAFYGKSISKIHAINRNLEEVAHFDWKVLVNVSDDVEFIVPGFDVRILSDMELYFPSTDGVLHYNDGTLNGHRFMTVSIIGKLWFERTKRIYHPEYISVYCDEEETRRANDMRKLKYFPNVLFKHNHWLFNPKTKDAQNEITDHPTVHEQDRRTYLRRNPILLIKYASRGRKQLFFETLDNIESTIRTPYYKIIVSADSDDPSMNNDETRVRVSKCPNASIFYSEPTSKVGAINSHMEFSGDWSWCITMSDDMKFIVKGWDELMLNDIRKEWGDSLDFFAHFNDNYVGYKLPTLNVVGREYFQRDNYIYHPSYNSVSCDAENMFVAMMRGKHKYFQDVYFHHIHPSNLNKVSDETYRRNDQYGNLDTENYFERRKRLFDVANPVFIPFNPNDRR